MKSKTKETQIVENINQQNEEISKRQEELEKEIKTLAKENEQLKKDIETLKTQNNEFDVSSFKMLLEDEKRNNRFFDAFYSRALKLFK